MNGSPRARLIRTLIVITLAGAAAGQKLDLSGQASGWLGFSSDSSNPRLGGLRYIPTLSAGLAPFDADASVNAFGTAQARMLDSIDADAKVKPYRLWARFSTTRFEARAGLQKINFGSATLLRPLQWFDRIDPRDPLGLTDGVYGLLGRYYFQNNANLWAWGLIGNSSPKGWETYGSEKWRPEFGSRAQLPVPRGEVAATYHHRRADLHPHLPDPFVGPIEADEDRVGIDGKWDVGVGLWLEAVMSRQRSDFLGESWQRIATVGLDYTIGVGSGLTLLAEHMVVENAVEAFGAGQRMQVSAAMASLPFGLVDNLRSIVLYDWSNKSVYSYVGWQRTLDNWLFSVAAFWNPDTLASFGAPGGGAAGKGVQLMVVFNH